MVGRSGARRTRPAPDRSGTLPGVGSLGTVLTRIGSRLSVLVLAVELARLADAIAERNRTRQQLAYARTLQRSAEPVRTTAAASRDGTGPWTVDTTPVSQMPAPEIAETLRPAEPPQRSARTSQHELDELRLRQQEQQRRNIERDR